MILVACGASLGPDPWYVGRLRSRARPGLREAALPRQGGVRLAECLRLDENAHLHRPAAEMVRSRLPAFGDLALEFRAFSPTSWMPVPPAAAVSAALYKPRSRHQRAQRRWYITRLVVHRRLLTVFAIPFWVSGAHLAIALGPLSRVAIVIHGEQDHALQPFGGFSAETAGAYAFGMVWTPSARHTHTGAIVGVGSFAPVGVPLGRSPGALLGVVRPFRAPHPAVCSGVALFGVTVRASARPTPARSAASRNCHERGEAAPRALESAHFRGSEAVTPAGFTGWIHDFESVPTVKRLAPPAGGATNT